jgi:hypothetical protein
MTRKHRPAIALLLIAFLVNALCWSVSPDAFADWISTEQGAAEQLGVSKQPVSGDHSQKSDKPCNEGCHACCHFQGVASLDFPFSPQNPPQTLSRVVKISTSVVPNHPRRPPRISFLA